MNSIQTWRQGEYIDQRKYDRMSDKWKHDQGILEKHLVRPALEDNAICNCADPQDAIWIAKRLNLASLLEQLTYDFATGKTDGSKIIELVKKNIS